MPWGDEALRAGVPKPWDVLYPVDSLWGLIIMFKIGSRKGNDKSTKRNSESALRRSLRFVRPEQCRGITRREAGS